MRDLEPGVTHYLGGVQSTGPLPTPSSVTMWRPGRDGGQREIGTLLQVGERKALLEITDPAAVRALLNGITLRDIAVRP